MLSFHEDIGLFGFRVFGQEVPFAASTVPVPLRAWCTLTDTDICSGKQNVTRCTEGISLHEYGEF